MLPNRLDLLKTLLTTKNLTHLYISDTTDVLSVCGFKSSNASLLVSRKANYLFTDFRYRTLAVAFCKKNPAWTFIEIRNNGLGALRKKIRPKSTLGFQSEALSVDRFLQLRRALKNVTLVRLSGTIPELSMVKTRAEVAVMKQCAVIAESALKKITAKLRIGITERETANLLDGQCRKLGAESMGFDTIVLFGSHSALVHGVPGNRKLSKGDWVLVDFGCALEGLRSDMTRTFVYGKASPKQRKLHALVYSAQERCRKNIRCGMAAADADALARTIIDRAGYRNYFGHGTGHGVGYRIHEAPRVAPSSKETLRENSIVTVEPGVYLPGFGGVRIEDMVWLKSNGTEVLTKFPRELIEIKP